MTRRRILEAAARLFASRGFEATSIAAVMAECELTTGGFYAHFKSKAQLYKEAITGACVARECLPQMESQIDTEAQPERLLEALDCTFLATDAGSASPEVRQAYAIALAALRQQLDGRNPFGATSEQTSALAAAAVLIGSRAVHASIDDQALQHTMAEACRTALQKIMEPERPTYFWSVEDRPRFPALSSDS